MAESEKARTRTIRLTDDEHTRALGWAYMIYDNYPSGWDELDEALSEALLPDSTPTEGEPERCPTCGSDDRKRREIVGASGRTGSPVAPRREVRCPNRWHSRTGEPRGDGLSEGPDRENTGEGRDASAKPPSGSLAESVPDQPRGDSALTRDDCERLHSIATSIAGSIEGGQVLFEPDGRDVRFLRDLAHRVPDPELQEVDRALLDAMNAAGFPHDGCESCGDLVKAEVRLRAALSPQQPTRTHCRTCGRKLKHHSTCHRDDAAMDCGGDCFGCQREFDGLGEPQEDSRDA